MHGFFRVLMLSLGLLTACAAQAEMVVIVNPDSGVEFLNDNDLINIYMGHYQKLPSGITAFPVDLTSERESFYSELVNKTLPEINSYWARLVFSGRASPPRQVRDPAEMVDIVGSNRGAIGYVDRALVNDSVTIVYTFPPLTTVSRD